MAKTTRSSRPCPPMTMLECDCVLTSAQCVIILPPGLAWPPILINHPPVQQSTLKTKQLQLWPLPFGVIPRFSGQLLKENFKLNLHLNSHKMQWSICNDWLIYFKSCTFHRQYLSHYYSVPD